ncbi:MAG: zinc-ribbon domain-containing protein [Pyrinomonadaceae bacterium]
MSLLFCPECGHEISANAVACPNCGHPVTPAAPVVDRKVVVARTNEKKFPTWAFIPIGLLAFILLFVMYLALRQSDDQANTNVNVNMAGRRTTDPSKNVTIPSTDTGVTLPPQQTTNIPGQSVTVAPGQTTTVPGAAPPVSAAPERGTVIINARVTPARGSVQTVRNTKFYLLDKDLETILREARIEPIEGNSLAGSLGLAAVFPDRYGDFQRSAMRAISAHVKYSGTTGGDGSANLTGIPPDSYYLFGVTRFGRGFAMWNAPVSVIGGQNILNLSPQNITEIPDSSD